jgi:hypothetical protein
MLLTGRPQGCENLRFKRTHVVLVSNNCPYYTVRDHDDDSDSKG